MNLNRVVFIPVLLIIVSFQPELAIGQTRLGLHVTQEELNIWRQRAISGPYKSTGDVSQNSPGDWDRINSNAEIFRLKPNAGIWEGPTGTGCVSGVIHNPPKSAARLMRDAAFKALIKKDDDLKTKVRGWILAQAAQSNLNFRDRAKWCVQNSASENPFMLAEWINIILHGLDYIEILDANVISSTDRQKLRDWFFYFGEMANESLKSSAGTLFVDRLNNNYTPKLAVTSFNITLPPFFERNGTPGPIYGIYGKYWNNRKNAVAFAVANIGVKFDIPDFKSHMVRYAKEVVRYAVFPQGFVTDFERWTDNNGAIPDKGWQYACSVIGQALGIADVIARTGDTSVHEFTTSSDLTGSGEISKSLLFAMQSLSKYVDLTFDRYATNQPDLIGNQDYRIDGRYNNGKQALNHLYWVIGNIYYKDPYVKSIYMRTAPRTIPYPPISMSQNGALDYQGQSGMYPGVLFMFGQMEGKVWPYSSLASTSSMARPSAPTLRPIPK